jgi:uncharacterized membrane protein YcaP (DUF421 family)
MGKKQLSQLTLFDYVVGISIGSISGGLAVDPSVNYIKGITGLIIYALFPIILSLLSLKNYKFRKLLDGKPTILVNKGQIVEENLKKTKLTINDVLEECRLKNAFDIADVEFAILETSGKVSIELKSANQPLTPKDMNIKTINKALCIRKDTRYDELGELLNKSLNLNLKYNLYGFIQDLAVFLIVILPFPNKSIVEEDKNNP